MARNDRLAALRAQMARHKVGAYLVPSADAFQGEYVPAAARRLEFLTGFTGSAGFAVVGAKKAAFFTDGRYTLQAETQVDAAFARHNQAALSPREWVARELPKGTIIGFDPALFTVQQLAAWKQQGFALKATPNLIDAIWKKRPPYPKAPAFAYPQQYAGETAAQKIKRVTENLKADALFIAAPESVCWLLNIRGHDIPHTPFLNATALLFKTGKVILFAPAEKVPAALRKNITLADAPPALGKKTVQIDPRWCSVAWGEALTAKGAKLVQEHCPTLRLKACKNKVEQKHIRATHEVDGAALSEFLCWLDTHWQRARITEMAVAEKLRSFRAARPGFVEESFATIAGMGGNGAIVHYHATPQTDTRLTKGLFLLDSGGQYWGGTTDVTRTIALGKPTREQQEDFTRVLKGHIALARAVFPKSLSGGELDALARMPLWQVGKDYDHGTGHGVGCFLSVHEGPQGISRRAGGAALEPGMVLSNEPGFYKAGEYGIRIENLLMVVAQDERFLRFDTLTLAPIDRRLILPARLSGEERAWLNAYHARVLNTLRPLVDKKTGAWLSQMCEKV